MLNRANPCHDPPEGPVALVLASDARGLIDGIAHG